MESEIGRGKREAREIGRGRRETIDIGRDRREAIKREQKWKTIELYMYRLNNCILHILNGFPFF